MTTEMKTMTVDEFTELLEADGWEHEQSVEVAGDDYRYEGEDEIGYCWGWAFKKSKLDGIEITYQEVFSRDDYEPDSLSTTDNEEPQFSVDGVRVVDEDGDELSAWELDKVIKQPYLSDFFSIDYSELDDGDEVIEIDTEGADADDIISLKFDNQPELRFVGERIARATAKYTGVEVTKTLYQTKSGSYVCHLERDTIWANERNSEKGKVCKTPKEVMAFFGDDETALELYRDAGFYDDVIEIDTEGADEDDIVELEFDYQSNIRFVGERIASATGDYPGAEFTMTLYQTKGGDYVCYLDKVALGGEERDLQKFKICKSRKEVVEFFGYSTTAYELYDEAGFKGRELEPCKLF